MKKLIILVTTTFLILFLSGCSKNYDKLSYTTYNEYFKNKAGYAIVDQTDNYDLSVRRYLEAGDGNIQFFYVEFDTEINAKKYIEDMYKNQKKYKINKDYTYVQSKKNVYFKLYRVDNIIVYGTTNNKKNKRQMKSILKDLGY